MIETQNHRMVEAGMDRALEAILSTPLLKQSHLQQAA